MRDIFEVRRYSGNTTDQTCSIAINNLTSIRGHATLQYDPSEHIWTKLGSDIDGEADWDYSGDSVSLSSDGSVVAIGANRKDGSGAGRGRIRCIY